MRMLTGHRNYWGLGKGAMVHFTTCRGESVRGTYSSCGSVFHILSGAGTAFTGQIPCNIGTEFYWECIVLSPLIMAKVLRVYGADMTHCTKSLAIIQFRKTPEGPVSRRDNAGPIMHAKSSPKKTKYNGTPEVQLRAPWRSFILLSS